MKQAEQRLCVCEDEQSVVRVGGIEIDHELAHLDEFYCTECNSFWREP